ncbi:MAG: hypothetical protein ABEJ23_02650 [Haloarculaceae archaeon]
MRVAPTVVTLGVFVSTMGILLTGTGLVGALGDPLATVPAGIYLVVAGLVVAWSLTYARSLR